MKIAALQTVSGAGVAANLEAARGLLACSREAGAELAVLPEFFCLMGQRDRDKLDAMIAYAQSALCRWHLSLRYFGESLDADACGTCDNCRRQAQRQALPAAS